MKAVIIAILLLSTLGFAQLSELEPTYISPASDWIIEKANAHIMGFVGEDYFNSNIILNESFHVIFTTQEDQYKVTYLYSILNEDVAIKAKNFIVWLNKDGDVFDYTGPRKPYQFLITKEQAIEIAKASGLQNPVGAVIDTVYDMRFPRTYFGDYAWIISDEPVNIPCPTIEEPEEPVSGPSPEEPVSPPSPEEPVSVPCGFRQKTAYIEVDTGVVLDVFDETGQEAGGAVPSRLEPTKQIDQINLILISILAVIIVIIAGFIYYKKK